MVYIGIGRCIGNIRCRHDQSIVSETELANGRFIDIRVWFQFGIAQLFITVYPDGNRLCHLDGIGVVGGAWSACYFTENQKIEENPFIAMVLGAAVGLKLIS